MKFKLLSTASALFLLASVQLSSQGVWTVQTSQTTNNLRNIFFINNNTGWAVGDFGAIRYTNNGGSTPWTGQASNTFKDLKDIYFPTATTGFAVGQQGTIVKTTNGGTTWTLLTAPTTEDIYGVWFVDASNGWIVGTNGKIMKTTNGGTSWTSQTSAYNGNLYDCFFFDANTGFICGNNGSFQKTTNGGGTWTAQTTSVTDTLKSITFGAAAMGLVVGSAGRALGTDGNGTFIPANTGNSLSQNGTFAINSTTAWIVGDSGKVYKTNNSGVTWASENSNALSKLNSVFFCPSDTIGYLCGNNGAIRKMNTNPSGIHNYDDNYFSASVFPNPAKDLVNLSYEMKTSGKVIVELFDMTGKKVSTLSSETQQQGKHELHITLNRFGIAPGNYFLKISAGDQSSARKLIIE